MRTFAFASEAVLIRSRTGFAITFGGGRFVSDLAENRSETASDLSENRSETKVGDTRPGQDTKENSFHAALQRQFQDFGV